MLELINSPEDLKAVDEEKLEELISEIREFLISTAEHSGGHLASNLGVVELTVALHRVFDSPRDRIIFDVGHQSYVHKIITGRRGDFDKLRIPGGLSGFTTRRESIHDPFGAGHSSTSISAALGFAMADRLNKDNRYTVSVIGDGAYTGGMAHEALNNLPPDLPLIIVLNENGMSISSNKGSFARYLSRFRASAGYIKWKSGTNNAVLRIPKVGKRLKRALTVMKDALKKLIFSKNYFEELGLYYVGPIDGNDYKAVSRALERAKALGKTTVVHVKTVKGKGYLPAENAPDGYHSISSNKNTHTFSKEFAKILTDRASSDERIVAVTAAMGLGTGLNEFESHYPERYFDVGIAEEHAITFSSALAAAGKKPFAAIYSTFIQRGYDNLIHDLALQCLPATIVIDRAGLSLADGATHHGIFDVSFLSHMPNFEIFAPVSYRSLEAMIDYSISSDKPIAIRYPNSSELSPALSELSEIDRFILTDFSEQSPPQYVVITYGAIAKNVLDAKRMLIEKNVKIGTVVLERLKPYRPTAKRLLNILSGAKGILFVEEGIRYGGASEILLAELIEAGLDTSVTHVAISAVDDSFAIPDSPTDLYDYVGLSPKKISEKILNL